DPNNLDARKLLGRIYLRTLGDMQSGSQSQDMLRLAIEQYEQITRLEPNNIENHLLLGRLYRTNNEMAKAENEFKVAARTEPDADPQDAQAYLRMAEIYRRTGKFDLALDSLKKAEGIVPDSLEVPFTRAQIYEAQGRYDEAGAIVQDLVQKTTKPAGNYSASE